MNFFSCQKCFNILKDPVQCKYCQNNFCLEHIKNWNSCPKCGIGPFSYIINNEIRKILENIENEKINPKIKNDNEIEIECSICPFKAKPGFFCFHFYEKHKKEIIEKFGRKIVPQNEKETRYKRIPQIVDIQNKKTKINNFNTSIDNQNPKNTNNLNNLSPKNSINKNGKIIKISLNLEPNIFRSCKTKRKNEKVPNNNLKKSKITNLYYCNKKNKMINCDCCLPDHICCEGNCLCIDCMEYNIKLLKLFKGKLINKAGRVAGPENNIYHCGAIINNSIKNSVGQELSEKKTCRFLDRFCCEECKILNKYKNIYLKNIYHIK